MFKWLLTITLLLTFSGISQTRNPDGDNVSIHLTPFFTSLDVKTNTIESKKEDPTFNLNVMLKIPLSANFTFSPFYQFGKSKYSFETSVNVQSGMESSYNNFGATFSYYLK